MQFKATLGIGLGVAMLGLSACSGPGSKQIQSTFGLNAQTDDTCTPGEHVNGNVFFAAPVCTQYKLSPSDTAPTTAPQADGDKDETKTFIYAALNDSRTKCRNFVGLFTGAQAAENTTLDILSLILSGLGSVLTPVDTVRALSAGSTAVQGSKQAINTDMFQQMSMLIFVQQINSTYYQKLDDAFTPANVAGLSASAALAQIQDIHRYCSIPFAAASINAPQGGTTGATGKTDATKYTIAIGGKITAGDVVSLNVSGAAEGLSQTITYTVVAHESVTSIASALIDAIYHKLPLAQAGVTATLPASQPTAGSAQFTVQGGPSDIVWAATPAPAGVGGAAATETVNVTAPSKGS